jgi:CelD/BcsL family acetyltransferase involved in cellulose biosynthesis
MAIDIKIVVDVTAWDALRPQWDTLFRRSLQAATPLRFEWLWNWWRVYGPSYGMNREALRIVTFWRDQTLVGVLPLYAEGLRLGTCRFRFISTGEAEEEETCPDYLNLLCAPGEERSCLTALGDVFGKMKWDVAELLDIPEQSLLLQQQWWPGPVEVIPRGVCPIANLEGGFEAYLMRLSSNSRQIARRHLRSVIKAGAVFELAGNADSDEFFDNLIELHQLRWTAEGKPGCFASSRFTEFHRTLSREWTVSGDALLARLSLNGRSLAVLYGFITGSKFDFYQSGIRREGGGIITSPGNAAHLLLMSLLAARGVQRYDFLRGSSAYKERLATDECPLFMVRAWNRSIRGAGHRSSVRLARAAKRGIRLLHREGSLEPMS